MDFHSLARKELQALCKKNKIPANMTNVAMADALKALEKVEGLDELNSEPRSDPQESPARTTNVEPRTACRTSTRRKPINVEPESSQSMTRNRRATRRTVAEETGQENKNVNLLETPAMPTTRRRVQAASATRKMDAQLTEIGDNEEQAGQENSDVPVTPAMRTSRRKVPAVSTRRKTEAQKDEKSVQRVYGTRQSVRLLEKSIEDLSLKEKKRVEAVKIEGLCEETEQKNDVPGEFLSWQNIDESLENENEMQHGVQEDSKTNDHEIDNKVVSFQNLDQLLENVSEIKDKLHEHQNNAEVEVQSDVPCQNIDQLHKNESETKLQHQEDKKGNDHEVVDYDAEIGSQSCTNLDNDSGLDEDDEENSDSSDESSFQQVETSGDVVDMNCEAMEEKGSDIVITDNSETLNAALKPEIEKELNGSQDSLIVEMSDDDSVIVMETIVNFPDEASSEVMDSLTLEVSGSEGKSYEKNSMEDEQHGSHLHLDAAIEEECEDDAIEELPEGNGSDEVQENVNADKIQHKLLEKSDSIKEEPESPRFILQHESYEMNSVEDERYGSDDLHLDAAIGEECDDNAIKELPEGNGSDEVQENVNADKIQHKLLEKSDSIKEEPESPRFILQHESYEMNSVEDERHGSDDLHLDAAIGEECDDNAIKELPEGNGSDEVQENVNADKIQHKLLEKSDSIKEEPESPRFILQHESYEMNSVEDERHGNDDAAIGEECDDNAIKELPEGNESDEVQENGNADKIQDKLLEKCEELPDSIKEELESPRFILQHEKCEKASDDLANEYNNVGVNVMEAKESDMIIHDQKSSFCCPLVSDSEVAIEIPLGDDHVVPVEAAYACIQTLNKSPTSLKQMSPYQTVVSGDQVTGGTVSTVISSPFAANTIQGQFPRPNESTARKSSTKKQATIQKIINADINKENVENSGRKVEPKKDKIKKKEAEEEKQYEDISLRQLTKMVKEKLQIANKNNDGRNISKVGTRPALQVLTENCKAAGEPENKN
ncbi:titin homolog [Manihot esculenta]|uniref:Uncharacterized protein n=1 Tax=Manihot esculenta TaxID=3983 RepID=A0ACB7HAJ1_MANES|nr:titin homolog [Manihot esculenta]KAG8647906.1 hypothetical protein MANES_09G124200v8 [Manihot esculenta]